MALAYLSLGSNLGSRPENLRLGVTIAAGEDRQRVSSVYQTSPVGGVVQDDFWNLVVEIETSASPKELLARCRAAELAAQRVRTLRNGPRTLDVDVLLVGEITSDDPEILLPHPRMWERRFVLAPLGELRPDLAPPTLIAAATGEVEIIGTLFSLR
ncbi:MAG: 2-amino-4-hydroxy-6-hydroxymethyldihydropteridine diphosphokinase [Actinomycetota bacterium]|jgi:2-amino-4-hydroxy-6-hydroxymethyldihydropteridine diphosphokinase